MFNRMKTRQLELNSFRSTPIKPVPEDLLEWLDNDMLVSLVSSAVASELSRDHCGYDHDWRSQAATGLLVYCYAQGIYASYEIASLVSNDRRFLDIANSDATDWHWVRRYRRNHCEAIHRSLMTVLRSAWEHHHRCDNTGRDVTPLNASPDFELEAETRLRQAMFHDCMALDE